MVPWSFDIIRLKGKKNPLNNFLTPSRGFLSKPRNSSTVGEAEHSVTVPAQRQVSVQVTSFPVPTDCFLLPVAANVSQILFPLFFKYKCSQSIFP